MVIVYLGCILLATHWYLFHQGIPKRYSDIDVALLHLAETTVMGIMLTMAIPIHYNDYDVFKSTLEDFQILVREGGLEDQIHYLMHGDTYAILK